jgi:hypothetical protein
MNSWGSLADNVTPSKSWGKLFQNKLKNLVHVSFRKNTSLCWHWLSLDADHKTCSSLHCHGKSVSISIKATELRNRQCLNDVGSLALMSLFIDTTDVANLGCVPDVLSVHLQRVSSLVVLPLIQDLGHFPICCQLQNVTQLWNVIWNMWLTGFCLITS